MDGIETALLVLIIAIAIIIIISFLYQKQNNIKTQNQSLESFANYQDVKTKTINWCTKMQNAGLLTFDQFDSCISTFQDATTGIMPKQFKTPNTGMSRNYSLYNTSSKPLTSNVSGDNSNNIMLVNSAGYYMACDKNNSVYFIKDINNSSVNQQEIFFTLIPQTNNVYMIMSSYGKYLIANAGPSTGDTSIPTGMSSRQDWCASFSGKKIGPMTTWNAKILESNTSDNSNNGNNGNKATFESVQLANFFLSSSQNTQDNSLIINYGSDDTNIWQMIPKSTTQSSTDTVNNYGTEYIVIKESILTNLASVNSQIICVKAFIESLNKLQDIVKNNYTNIETYMEQILNNSGGTSDTMNPITNPNITQNPLSESFTDINMSVDDKNTVINNIINMKNNYLQQINSDIVKLNNILTDLNNNILDVDTDYNNFLNDISSKLSETKNKLNENNSIMDRQKDIYDKLNNEYSDIDKQKVKTDKIDEIAKINTDLISKSSSSNSTLVIIYPLIIFIMSICLIYLIYLTYNKFMITIYVHYFT